MPQQVGVEIGRVEHNASADLVVRQAPLTDERADHEDRHAQHRRRFLDRHPPPRRRPACPAVFRWTVAHTVHLDTPRWYTYISSLRIPTSRSRTTDAHRYERAPTRWRRG